MVTTGARIVYIMYVLLGTLSRILALELFIMSLGPGKFSWIYLILLIHVTLVIIIDVLFDHWYSNFQIKNVQEVFQQCLSHLRRGLSKIYIHYPESKNDQEIIWKHLIIDSLIVIETFIFNMMAMNGSYIVPYLGIISAAIWISFFASLFFKLLFYLDQHPWSTIIKNDVFNGGRVICLCSPNNLNGNTQKVVINHENINLIAKA